MMPVLPEITASVEQFVREHQTTFWGQQHTVQPELVNHIFGDGAHVIAVTPINTRPNYYVVRVDSGWSINNQDWLEQDTVGEHLNEILEVIEEEFGDARYNRSEDPEAELWEWPALDDDAGVCWAALIPRWGHEYD